MEKEGKPLKKFDPTDPKIAFELKKHCFEGWSPRSFAGKIIGGEKAYSILMRVNPEFAITAKTYEDHNYRKSFS